MSSSKFSSSSVFGPGMLKLNFSVFASFSCQLFLLPVTLPLPYCDGLVCKLYLLSLLLHVYLIWSYSGICPRRSRKQDSVFLSCTLYFKASHLLWQSHFFPHLFLKWGREGEREGRGKKGGEMEGGRKTFKIGMGLSMYSLLSRAHTFPHLCVQFIAQSTEFCGSYRNY